MKSTTGEIDSELYMNCQIFRVKLAI